MKNFIKVFFIFLAIISLGFTEKNDKNECRKVHKGSFIYGDEENPVMVIIKGNKHIETHDGGRYMVRSNIKWISECEYEMTVTEADVPGFPHNKGDVIKVVINTIVKNEVRFTATRNDLTWEGILYRTSK
jgi:hypothetical protein